jgi:hypothetical protein
MRSIETATNGAKNHIRSFSTASISSNSVVDGYVRALVDGAAHIRMPELLGTPHPGALYQVLDRNGVGVIALRTTRFSEAQLSRLMSFRLAQYVSAGLVDPHVVYRDGLQHDLPSSVSTGDVHLIAGVPRTGQILCYMVLRAVVADGTLRHRRRPLFPVEEAFGRGIYNNLPSLADFPIARILEISRFVKNQQIGVHDEGILRSPIEIVAALHQVVCDQRHRIAALIGDIDHRVGACYFGFFHMPTLMLRDATPITPDEGFLGWAAQSRSYVPFAILTADLARYHGRLASIERALALPGLKGVRALLALRRDSLMPLSSLKIQPVQAQTDAQLGDRPAWGTP